MKLNNKGWGTTEMIVISLALLIALIVSIYFISKLYGSFSLSNSNKIYVDLENNLVKATRKYVRDNDINVVTNYRVSYELLKQNGYINELKDSNNKDCNGYVIITNLDSKVYYKGYVICENYVTENRA